MLASNEFYHSIIEHNPDAVFILSNIGKITKVNQMGTTTFGYSQNEMKDMFFQDLIIPNQEEEYRYHLSQVLNGVPYESEFDAFRKNKEICHIQVKSIPLTTQSGLVGIFCVVKDLSELQKTKRLEARFKAVFNSSADAIDILRDSQNNISALSGIARDVTERKQLEESLKESEERYHKFLEYIPKGVVIHENGKIHYANPSALKILKEPNLIDKSIFSYIHSDFRELYKDRLSKIGNGTELPFTEIKMLQKDGKVICVEIGGVSIENDGIPVILTLFSDVTEKMKIERDLKESEERYRLLADNSLDLIQLVNLDGIVTYASPSHHTVLGYDPDEYVGKKVFYQPDGGRDERFKASFLKMYYTQKTFTCEIVRKHKEGYEVWVELKATPMFDKAGDFHYMMMVGRDITERKKLEEHLEYLGFHDALTGIPNRRLFQEKVEQRLKEAKRYQRKFAVMYMDMDKFKHINDTLGHEIGDELLKKFSNKVKRQLRGNDTLARQGGDEFTILLSEIQEETDAYRVAERILRSLQESWQIDEHIFQTTSSIGIAFYPKDGITFHELMKHADTALYQAKEDGRNNYKAYKSEK
ncbi:PAS domain S-box protein [Neobacillus sp. 114]|uniref:PAS domain S-box protein n=1 Tax=Neobacillus sp. 114 TaxID=3048535 RepID=UPI0024C3E0A9|nr:PAS domain S-box protein [Neobacillus sp. 114]